MNFSPIKKFLSWWGEKRIARMKELIASVPEGKALLDLASQENVAIGFDRKLLNQNLAAEIRNGLPREGETTQIALNPFLRHKALTVSLAHELRHLWQMRQLNDPAKINNIQFEKIAAFKRLMEADAFVFQNYMAVKIGEATGTRMPWHASPDRSFLQEFRENSDPRPENAASPGALKNLFDSFMASGVAERYDSESAALFDSIARYAAQNDKSGKPLPVLLREKFNNASFKEVGDIGKIPVIGAGENALRYLEETDADKLLDNIWKASQNPTIAALRKKYALA